MSRLLAALKAVEGMTGASRPQCPIANILANATEEEAEGLKMALASPVPHTVLTGAIRESGHPLGHRAVANHRRGLCSCRLTNPRGGDAE